MKARKRQTRERDIVDNLRERRAIKLLLTEAATPELERRLARQCRLHVAELRRRAI